MSSENSTDSKSPFWRVVICILVVACVLTVAGIRYWSVFIRPTSLQKAFYQAVETDGRVMVLPAMMLEESENLGRSDGREFLIQMAREHEIFDFDGDTRFCQILRDRGLGGGGPSDIVVLSLVVSEGNEDAIATWATPSGTVIHSVKIVDDGVNVSYSRAPTKADKKDKPKETFLIPWRPSQKPEVGVFGGDGPGGVVKATIGCQVECHGDHK